MDELRRDHHRDGRRRRHARKVARKLGQADPPARAGRLAATRARELARRGRLRPKPLRLDECWYDEEGKPFSPRCTTTSVAPRSSTARRSTASEPATSTRCATTPASRRPGRSATRTSSRTTRGRSSSTRSTARAARIRPSRPPAARTRSRRSRTSRESSSSRTTSRPPGTTRSTPLRHSPARGEPSVQRLRALHELRRVPLPRPREVRRRGDRRPAGARARERHPAHERARCAAGDERRGHRCHGGPRRAGRRDRALQRRPRCRLLRCGQLGRAPARLGERATPERPCERLRPGRAQLHLPREPGGARALARGEPDGVPKDARPERLLLVGRRGLRVPAREHPDDRQVAGADVPRREAARDVARPRVVARADRQALGRLLALDRGSAAPREPRHPRR